MQMLNPANLPTLDARDYARVAELVGGSLSANTRRTYRCQWLKFARYCDLRGVDDLPATAETVAAYLADRFAGGASASTCVIASAAIAKLHSIAGHDSPVANELVKTTLGGIRRKAKPQRQAKPITAHEVAVVRGSLQRDAKIDESAALSLAIVSLTSYAGLRISEAAALRWRDIVQRADGTGRVTIARSKTDQEGKGAVVAIPGQVMRDLRRLRRLQDDNGDNARVFQRCTLTLARRITKACEEAGLGEGYSGHSGRHGMAISMTRNGAPAQIGMQHGRWASTDMVARYIRAESAGEALRYL